MSDKQPPEHDRRKRQETKQQRANQNVARRTSLTKEQRRDQANAEGLRLIGNIVVALDQDDFAGPGLRKSGLVKIKQRVISGVGVLQTPHADRPRRLATRAAPCTIRF